MNELLVFVLKMLVMLIIGPIICTVVFAWDIFDRRSLKVKKRGEKTAKQLIVGIFTMIVLYIFIYGAIKGLM